MAENMLTTVDNPYNPFTDFDEWYAWDARAGYHTLAYLARIVRTSHELSDAYDDAAVESAIDEIVAHNLLGVYKKLSSDNKDPIVPVDVHSALGLAPTE